jgi:hypothetical protein
MVAVDAVIVEVLFRGIASMRLRRCLKPQRR